jgi:hypothetical protein
VQVHTCLNFLSISYAHYKELKTHETYIARTPYVISFYG